MAKARMIRHKYSTGYTLHMTDTCTSLLQVAAILFLITAAAGRFSSADRRLEKKSILASVCCFLF